MTLPPPPSLPEPKPGCLLDERGWVTQVGHYDADQLRTYAEQYGRLCAEAERAECAKLCGEPLAAVVELLDPPGDSQLLCWTHVATETYPNRPRTPLYARKAKP